jgi:hypothetical protein
MRQELDEALCRDFPLLYAERSSTVMRSCMAWGFECGDGWEPLIRALSGKLEALIAAQPEDERATASQVKEKFGTLRFYMDGATDAMYERIAEAEDESAHTCEECGKPGHLRGKGWVFTACDDHAGEVPEHEA